MDPQPTILLVDDEADFLEATADLLESEGYGVVLAHGGDAAMQVLQTQRVDLVILDLDMPQPDGWAVFTWMRRQPALKATPVMIFSATPVPRGLQDQVNVDAPSWLDKLVDREELLSGLRKHLQPV